LIAFIRLEPPLMILYYHVIRGMPTIIFSFLPINSALVKFSCSKKNLKNFEKRLDNIHLVDV
jgi:hypothetical protein